MSAIPSLVAPAILSKGVIGRDSENSNPQPNPQLFSSPSYSSPQPSGIRPARLVFHRCLPACIQVRFILPHLAMWLKSRVYSVLKLVLRGCDCCLGRARGTVWQPLSLSRID